MMRPLFHALIFTFNMVGMIQVYDNMDFNYGESFVGGVEGF